jgi:hypothetical protein
MAKTASKFPCTSAHVTIKLDLCVELGCFPLEEALTRAQALKVEDILDLKHCDVNDLGLVVYGVTALNN